MRVHRLLLLLPIVAVGLVLSTQPAVAAPYPAEPPAAGVSDGTITEDGTVTFSGSGFASGESITIEVNYISTNAAGKTSGDAATGGFVTAYFPVPEVVVKTVTATLAGTFSTTVTLTQVGTAVLRATGNTSGVSVTATVRVLADAGNRGGNDAGLAVTGNSGSRLAWQIGGALAAIAFGAALIWFTARRRRHVGADA